MPNESLYERASLKYAYCGDSIWCILRNIYYKKVVCVVKYRAKIQRKQIAKRTHLNVGLLRVVYDNKNFAVVAAKFT